MTRRILLTICFLACAGSALAAPNFSGSWKMNAAKSKAGGQAGLPERFERKITHADPAIQLTTTRSGMQGGADIVQEAKYSTDGKETKNPFFGASEMKSVAKWEGNVLTIRSTGSAPTGAFTISERWTLSADGKVLEVVTKIAATVGEFESTYVLDKQ